MKPLRSNVWKPDLGIGCISALNVKLLRWCYLIPILVKAFVLVYNVDKSQGKESFAIDTNLYIPTLYLDRYLQRDIFLTD